MKYAEIRGFCERRLAAIIAMAAIAVLLAAASAWADAAELRVMSFNVRFSRPGVNETDPQDNWSESKLPRRERAIRVIRENKPDLLGVQEARDQQVIDLREALPELDFYGVGRDDGKTGGEFAGIFYRKARFERQDAGSFWLSATPENPGTSFYTVPGAVPRIASWMRLTDKVSGREVLVLNAHWDHIDAPARRKSAGLMRERLAKLAEGIPAIVMGDFNGPEDSPELTLLLGTQDSAGRALVDSYRKLHPLRSADESTFNDWNGRTAGSRIDFILHTDEFTPTAAAIVRTSYDGHWPSDHYPITTTLRLE